MTVNTSGNQLRDRAAGGFNVNPGWLTLRDSREGAEAPRPRVHREDDPAHLALAAHIGAQLIEERRIRGWSQQDLADRLGVDRTAVGRWERGARTMPLHRLMAAARLFGVSVEALLPAA
jgi:ribosome-binding protein aMBF1 (putative translation factor)